MLDRRVEFSGLDKIPRLPRGISLFARLNLFTGINEVKSRLSQVRLFAMPANLADGCTNRPGKRRNFLQVICCDQTPGFDLCCHISSCMPALSSKMLSKESRGNKCMVPPRRMGVGEGGTTRNRYWWWRGVESAGFWKDGPSPRKTERGTNYVMKRLCIRREKVYLRDETGTRLLWPVIISI